MLNHSIWFILFPLVRKYQLFFPKHGYTLSSDESDDEEEDETVEEDMEIGRNNRKYTYANHRRSKFDVKREETNQRYSTFSFFFFFF